MKNKTTPTCDQFHQQAMNAANLAVNAEKMGGHQTALQEFSKAFDSEKEAAMTLAYDFTAEPSRSVLFRSAAFLALKAKNYHEAERMAAFGLIGNPPRAIANELREALNQVFSHLKVAA